LPLQLKRIGMKKKLLIGAGVLIIVIIIGMMWINNRNRTLSPPGEANYDKGGLTIDIPYSRPSQKGRVIFGTVEEEALQPYGVYWRLGANEATQVTFNRDVLFNGNAIKAGTYRMYAVPGPDEFEISLNTGLGNWGAFEPDYSLDILKTMIPVEESDQAVEQYTIRFEEASPVVFIVCEWANMKIKIPVE